jgi:hypothetical protein
MSKYTETRGMSLMERFAFYVRKSDVGCWEWAGKINSSGYATVSHLGEWLPANRVSWLLHNGEIPDVMHVLHSCDNRRCTNPGHLFLGTNIDNIADKVSKGRQYRKWPPVCLVAGCVTSSRKLGLCTHHYNQQYHARGKRAEAA